MSKIKTFALFNEAVIKPEKENIIKFMNDINHGRNNDLFIDIAKIADKYGIAVVDYDTFYKNLPDTYKSKAPNKGGVTVFGFIDPVTSKPTIVYQTPRINPPMADHIRHMLEHEMVHLGQIDKRNKTTGFFKTDVDNDPKKSKEYFSDADEQMAFSQSISDILINQMRCRTFQEAIKKLDTVGLWKHVKSTVDAKVLNRYKKYIYQYLEQHFNEN